MPYYMTIEDDLLRAKLILRDGKLTEEDLPPLSILPQESIRNRMLDQSGTIRTMDNYAAYKLLESFVEEIERLRALTTPLLSSLPISDLPSTPESQ